MKWLEYETNQDLVDEIIGDNSVGFAENDFFGIFYDEEKQDWIASANISISEAHAFIFNIETYQKGTGRKIIDYLFNNGVDVIEGEATDESYGFWEKVGATFGERVNATDSTEFVIKRELK